MVEVVVVFDFDRTIIDCDSDRWVVDEMGVSDSFNLLRPTLPWNSLMNALMGEIHAQGKTLEDVAECLKRIPLDVRIIEAIRSAYALGSELRIVSDANQFFIETILKHHGLLDCFSEIITNPILVDQQGSLSILPFHDSTSSPHGCSCCPPNLCKTNSPGLRIVRTQGQPNTCQVAQVRVHQKSIQNCVCFPSNGLEADFRTGFFWPCDQRYLCGLVITRIRDSVFVERKKRFIYLGDGSGDFCPCLKLGEGDFVMPRKDFPLWNLICNSDPLLFKAEVHRWSNGDELEQILLHLINTILAENKKSMEPLAS